jgi:hypothetical protein
VRVAREAAIGVGNLLVDLLPRSEGA